MRILLFVYIASSALARAQEPGACAPNLGRPGIRASAQTLKAKAVDRILDLMGLAKGIPPYKELIKEAARTGSYDAYANFGEFGLAEIGISVRYNQARLAALDTGRPMIVVANHHLGIADGLAMQYLLGQARPNSRALLFLAKWIQTLLPFAVYDSKTRFGTAIPVEINLPKPSDPEFKAKMDDATSFNSRWGGRALKAMLRGAALIFFPAGHVSSLVDGEKYPAGVRDEEESWQSGYLDLAHAAGDKVDLVFAHVAAVNRKPFYKYRKLFGGGDKERVIWFLSEALAKRGRSIDVHFSEPMTLDAVYELLARKYDHTVEALRADRKLTAELMRRETYDLVHANPPPLDGMDSPAKKVRPPPQTSDVAPEGD